MKKKELFIVFIVTLILASCSNSFDEEIPMSKEEIELRMVKCDAIINELNNKNADTLGTIVKIPETIEECFLALDTLFTPALKEWLVCIPSEELNAKMHFGIGLYLRNNWDLWKGGKLSTFFESKGIEHPDNMSGIILYLYHRKLRGKIFDFDKFLEYQEEMKKKFEEDRLNEETSSN